MDVTKIYSDEVIYAAGVTTMRGRYFANLNKSAERKDDPGMQFVQLPSGIYLARDAVREATAEFLAYKSNLNAQGIGKIRKAQRLDDVYKDEIRF